MQISARSVSAGLAEPSSPGSPPLSSESEGGQHHWPRPGPPSFDPETAKCEYISYGLLASIWGLLTDTGDVGQYDSGLRALCDGKPSHFVGCSTDTVGSLATLVSLCCVWQEDGTDVETGEEVGFYAMPPCAQDVELETFTDCVSYCNAHWWYCMCASRIYIRLYRPYYTRAILAAFYIALETGIPLKIHPGVHAIVLPLWEAAKCAYRITRVRGGRPGVNAEAFCFLRDWYRAAFAANPAGLLSKYQASYASLPPLSVLLGTRTDDMLVIQRLLYSRGITRRYATYALDLVDVRPGVPFAVRLRASALFLAGLVIHVARCIYHTAMGQPCPTLFSPAPSHQPASRAPFSLPETLTSRELAEVVQAWVGRMIQEARAEARALIAAREIEGATADAAADAAANGLADAAGSQAFGAHTPRFHQALQALHARVAALGRLVEALDLYRRLNILVGRICSELEGFPGSWDRDTLFLRYSPIELEFRSFENSVELMYVDLLGYRWKRALASSGRTILGENIRGLSLCVLVILLAERHWSNPLFMIRLLAAVASISSTRDPRMVLPCRIGWRKLFYTEGGRGSERHLFIQVGADRVDPTSPCRLFDEQLRFACANPCAKALMRLILYYAYDEACDLAARQGGVPAIALRGSQQRIRDSSTATGPLGPRAFTEALLALIRKVIVMYAYSSCPTGCVPLGFVSSVSAVSWARDTAGAAGAAEFAGANPLETSAPVKPFSREAFNSFFYALARSELEEAVEAATSATDAALAAPAAPSAVFSKDEFDGASTRLYCVVDFLNHVLCAHPLLLSPSNYIVTVADLPPSPVPSWEYSPPVGPWGIGESRVAGPSQAIQSKYLLVLSGQRIVTPADFTLQPPPPRVVARARATAFARARKAGLKRRYPRPPA